MAKSNSPRIYVSLAAPTLSAMEALAIRVSGVPVGYELRLDYLQDFSQFESQLHQMLMRLHFPQTIATCRMATAGGMLELQKQIPQRVRAEEAFRSASLYARGLLEAALDPFVTISPEGKITQINRATELMIQTSRSRIL